MKKALIFSPYLNVLGGGEVYALNFAKCLEKKYQIYVSWNNKQILKKAKSKLGIKLDKVEIDKTAYTLLGKQGNLLKKITHLNQYDLIFFVSDGSIPWLFGKKNILHFQVPFTKLDSSFTSRLKLKKINSIVCNSHFTKNVIYPQLKVPCHVIYPPPNIKISHNKKHNTILAVGRFTKALTDKRQDILVDAFKTLVDQGLKGWKLKLIGSTSDQQGKTYVKELRKKIGSYPITISVNVDANQLSTAFHEAKIFWHAAGYGTDEKKHPERVEHFGLVTVEALKAGCVPIVINKGGQKEIVSHGANGMLFDTQTDLVKLTRMILKNNKLFLKLQSKGKKISQKFSKNQFCNQISLLT